MPVQTRIVSPGPDDRSVRTEAGEVLHPPADWVLLPPGDPALTRRVKAAGPTWAVQQKRGRKTFSLGLWAPRATIEAIRADLAAERDDPRYARKREADTRRREHQQAEYVAEFHGAVLDYLAFHARYSELAERLAAAVTEHATPVGSGTVARTTRIPVGAAGRGGRHRLDAAPDDRLRPDGIPRVEGQAARGPPPAGRSVRGAAGRLPGGPGRRRDGLPLATGIAREDGPGGPGPGMRRRAGPVDGSALPGRGQPRRPEGWCDGRDDPRALSRRLPGRLRRRLRRLARPGRRGRLPARPPRRAAPARGRGGAGAALPARLRLPPSHDERLAARAGSTRVLDHHATAAEDLAGLPFVTIDLDRSGAVLAWEHFHPGRPVPLLLRYVQDRDLWRWALPRSREVNAAPPFTILGGLDK